MRFISISKLAFLVTTLSAGFVGFSLIAGPKVGSGSVTVTETARISDTSLQCSVSETTSESSGDTTSYLATLTVKGYSNRPAVWDKTTGWWMDISKEPLFVYTPDSGGDVQGKVNIHITHEQYGKPLITDLMMGKSAIGTAQDVPFEVRYSLMSYEGKATISREITVNGYPACEVKFSPGSRKWTVK